jgi:hypothetical protein
MDDHTALLGAIGSADVEAAKGRVQALKAVEVKLSETQEEVVKLSAQIRDRDKAALLSKHEAKFTPAELDTWVKGASFENDYPYYRSGLCITSVRR